MSVATVADLDAAIGHVNRFGTGHTEAILTRVILDSARRFTNEVDAAAVLVNASTRFTDGEEFGFGAEIGISTQKLHARWPDGSAGAHHLQVRRLGRRPDPRPTPRSNPTRSPHPFMAERFASVPDVVQSLRSVDYLADTSIAGVMFLADRLEKPVLVEGPAGVGKTELAKAAAAITGARLIRLQCYEGLDESKAIYEWNYKKQLLRIQADREHERDWETVEADIFAEEFLLTRPLLEAIRSDEPVVLLIDEVDRVEIETEALLLEVLSDFQVSIPELGTIEGKQLPIVFLTSNNTRSCRRRSSAGASSCTSTIPTSNARRRSCGCACPRSTPRSREQIAKVVDSIRNLDLKKAPSISETIDWARTLVYLGRNEITPELMGETLHVLLKYQTDISKARKELGVDARRVRGREPLDQLQWSKLDYALSRAGDAAGDGEAVTSCPPSRTCSTCSRASCTSSGSRACPVSMTENLDAMRGWSSTCRSTTARRSRPRSARRS